MKKYKALSTLLIIFLILFTLLFIGVKKADIIPNVSKISIGTAVTIDNFYKNIYPIVKEDISPIITEHNIINAQKININYTTNEYGTMLNLSLKYGKYLSRDTNTKEIVISDTLATSLFLTDDVLGFTVIINGNDYRVCGIYFSNNSLLYKFSKTIYDDVYISLDCYNNKDIPLSSFIINGNNTTDKVSILNTFNKQFDTDYNYGTIQNLGEEKLLIKQNLNITLFITLIVIIAFLLYYLIRSVISIIKRKVEFNNTISFNGILLVSLLLVGIIIAIIFIGLNSFELTLPQGLINLKGSLFDYFITNIQIINSDIQNVLPRFSFILKILTLILSFVIFIFIPFLLLKIKDLIAENV